MNLKQLFVAISFLFGSVAFARDGAYLPEQSFYRCTFFNGNTYIHYHFAIDKDFGNKCSYGIEVKGHSYSMKRASAQDCRFFMRKLTQEVCISSETY